MKKLLFISFALAFFWGCEKVDPDVPVKDDEVIEGETPDKEETDTLLTDYVLPDILYASMSGEDEDDPETRTHVDKGVVLWQNGDAVSYFAGNIHNARFTYAGEDGLSNVELSKDNEKVGTAGHVLLKSQAVYPYDENITVVYEDEIDKIHLTYPVTQKYGVNSFGKDANIMVAAGTHNSDDNLYFRNACGYLVIKLYGSTKVKSITLSSVSGTDKIAGPAVVVASSDAAPVVTLADEASTAVTLDCSNGGEGVQLGEDKEHATEFWFALPPVSFTDGIKITVNDVNGNTYTKQTSNEVNIVRNEVQPMAALQFESNAPAATKLWYTRSDDSTTPFEKFGCEEPFNAAISQHKYDAALGKIVIEFASPLTTIKAYAFEDTNIATIVLPEGVTTIEESAFEDSYLREITIPGSMNNIGINVFYDCDYLSSVTFLPSATKTPLNIGCLDWGSEWGPFYDSPLTSINLNRELICVWEDGSPFTPDSWDQGMFASEDYKDVSSVSVTLGPQVETLSGYMFAYLPIQTLTIPGSVTEIHNDVFLGCTELATLTFEPSPFGTALTMGYDTDGEDENLFQDNNKLATLNLNREINYTFDESDITSDSEGLFGGIPTLTNVTLGDQVKTLHKYMFAGSGITSLNLNKVATIKEFALKDMRITELTIPGTVTTIQNDVFHGCEKLAALTFEPSPSGTPLTMGYDTYTEAENLFQDYSPLATLNLDREINYTLTNVDTDSEGLFGGMSTLTSVTLGQQVKKLSNSMFAGSSISELVIPGSVNIIENDVFHGCRALTSLTFKPSSTKETLTIGYDTYGEDENLFQNYCPLTTLDLDREINYTLTGVDTESEGLFGDMSTLTSVTLGDQVKTLHPYMFAGTGITAINLNKVETIGNCAFINTAIPSLTVPGYVNTIGNDVFNGCTALTSLVFKPSTSSTALTIGYNTIGNDDGPFIDCPLTTVAVNREISYTFPAGDLDTPAEGLFGAKSSLANVTIGDDVRTLLPYMFANSPITGIDLNKVTTIGKSTFEGATSLVSLNIPASVTSIDNFAFKNCSSLAILNILSGSSDLVIGYQPGSDDRGPFYQSPLKSIKLDRPIAMTDDYNTYCDQWDEGIFSNEYYNDDVEWTTDLILGPNVTTILKYMFAGTRIQQLHIPETVDYIGVNVIENNEKLNAIIFYDEKERPNVEYGAFGTESNDYINNTVLPPGKGQYYIFVPYRLGRLGSYKGELYYTQDDLMNDTYWDVLHSIMVDDRPKDDYYQPHRNTESWYLNVTGYDWYKARYYDYITITPPAI